MTTPYHEKKCLTEMPGWIAVTNRLSANAMFRTITKHELFGDQGGYPSIHEGYCLMHEGRRTVPEIHGDDFTEQFYRLDGCFALEFEEA